MRQIVHGLAIVWFTTSHPASYSVQVCGADGEWTTCYECLECDPVVMDDTSQFSRVVFDSPIEATKVRLTTDSLMNGAWLSFSAFHVLGQCVPRAVAQNSDGYNYVMQTRRSRAHEWHDVQDSLVVNYEDFP